MGRVRQIPRGWLPHRAHPTARLRSYGHTIPNVDAEPWDGLHIDIDPGQILVAPASLASLVRWIDSNSCCVPLHTRYLRYLHYGECTAKPDTTATIDFPHVTHYPLE